MTSITHIITGLNVGGAERALYTLLTSGLEGPFRNRVISLMGPGHYGPLIQEAGIPLTCLNMHPGRPTPGAVRRLLRASASAPADIFQGWLLHGNLAATLARRRTDRNAALVWNQRTSLNTLADEPLIKRGLISLEAYLSRYPDAIIYNSTRSRQQYAAHGYSDQRTLYLPNGFDTVKWSPNSEIRQKVRRDLGIAQDARVVGFVGRGHPDKDPGNLFAAFAKAAKKHPEAVLVTVGGELDQFAPRSGRVILLGQRPDIPDLMRSFDLLCLSSRVEGFPNVLGEAMASGVPCISTDVGDARDIVGDTGWIAPPRAPEKLAQCLDSALSCSVEELHHRGKRARERIKREYSISSVVEKYKTLYLNIAREKA